MATPERKTTIFIDVDLGDPTMTPDDCDLDEDCTAADVIAELKLSGSIHRALTDWDLLGYPVITVLVDGADGTRTTGEWKWSDE